MADQNPQPGTEASNPTDAAIVTPSSTTFGLQAFVLPTPKWANAAFDIYLGFYTAFLGWMAADSLFSPDMTKHIFYLLTLLITPCVKVVSKMFGVKVDDKTINN